MFNRPRYTPGTARRRANQCHQPKTSCPKRPRSCITYRCILRHTPEHSDIHPSGQIELPSRQLPTPQVRPPRINVQTYVRRHSCRHTSASVEIGIVHSGALHDTRYAPGDPAIQPGGKHTFARSATPPFQAYTRKASHTAGMRPCNRVE